MRPIRTGLPPATAAVAARILACALALGAPALFPGGSRAEDDPALARCAAIQDDAERLQCFDALARAGGPPAPPLSPLAERWELEPRARQGTFVFRPHRETYLLPLRYSTHPNDQPVSPSLGPAPAEHLNHGEAKFQISFKVKLFQGLFRGHADFWFAYTQQSNWQVYNSALSRPFRETDYEPEIVMTFPTDYRFLGLRGRLLNLGIVHQSNGRSDPLSRSWNRAFAQLGFERGDFALLVRPWYRFPERAGTNDNEDLQRYFGYGDVEAVYKHRGHTVSLLLRNNLRSIHRGAAKLGWTFPGHGQLKGYVQIFTGYGESLIDYNHSQTTLGLGFTLIDAL